MNLVREPNAAHRRAMGSSFAQNIDFSAGTAAAWLACVCVLARVRVRARLFWAEHVVRSCCLLTYYFIFIRGSIT